MGGFELLARALVKNPASNLQNCSPTVKEGLHKEAEEWIKRDFILGAIQLLKLLDAKETLTKLGNKLIKEKRWNYALEAGLYTKDKEILTKVGEELLAENEVDKASKAFTVGENTAMLAFIQKNF